MAYCFVSYNFFMQDSENIYVFGEGGERNEMFRPKN